LNLSRKTLKAGGTEANFRKKDDWADLFSNISRQYAKPFIKIALLVYLIFNGFYKNIVNY